MGMIQPYSDRLLYKINLFNKSKIHIGTLHICAFYSNTESWDHLVDKPDRAKEAAGPHNRMILQTLVGVDTSFFQGYEITEEENQIITKISNDLKKNMGIVDSQNQTVRVDEEKFTSAFSNYLLTQYKIRSEVST